jgi:hypothetical protein
MPGYRKCKGVVSHVIAGVLVSLEERSVTWTQVPVHDQGAREENGGVAAVDVLTGTTTFPPFFNENRCTCRNKAGVAAGYLFLFANIS